ncbi:MAG: hypothetical protein LRY71_12670 [Bacillaceae bacterium]|nr:hypothetical protein [Bacillaceae bacterium]
MGQRGLVGFALEVNDIQSVYENLVNKEVKLSTPKNLSFRWCFNLLKRTMPWKNSYVQEFEGRYPISILFSYN